MALPAFREPGVPPRTRVPSYINTWVHFNIRVPRNPNVLESILTDQLSRLLRISDLVAQL